MLVTLGAWIPALLLAAYAVSLRDVEGSGFAVVAVVYTPIALFLCRHWLFRRRRAW